MERDMRIIKDACSDGFAIQSKLTYVCTRNLRLLQSLCLFVRFLWTTKFIGNNPTTDNIERQRLGCGQMISKQCMTTDILARRDVT